MRLLAFDTSTDVLAVAACGPAGSRAVNSAGGAAASARLLPLAQEQLAAVGLGWRDLDAIAFGRGPGAFTGLRTSCAVAQGLGFGLARPVLPLDSLQVVAEDAFAQLPSPALAAAAPVFAVAMDARMDEIYGALYRRAAGRWQVLHEPALYGLEAWNAWLAALPFAPLGVAGSALHAFGERIAWPGAALRVPDERDRAAALLRLAHAMAHGEHLVDAACALPTYLRDKVALTSAEREARKAGIAAARAEAT